jgi:hypothetical protein
MTQPPTTRQLAHSLGAVSAGLQQMQASVAAGTLSIKPEAGQALATALQTASEGAVSLTQRMNAVSQPAQLGVNQVSSSMTAKFSGRGDGDNTALRPMLAQYVQLLQEAKAAVDASVSRYGATDGSISDDMGGR